MYNLYGQIFFLKREGWGWITGQGHLVDDNGIKVLEQLKGVVQIEPTPILLYLYGVKEDDV